MQDHDSIDYWPQEVLLAYFKNLEPAQIGTCAEVCKKWFQMSKDNEFWRQKCFEKWSSLPKEKDCKRNWLIPTKDGDELIDWQRVYGLKKHWPDVIKCLEQYYDILDKSPQQSKGKKAQKTALKKLLDSVAKKDWIALADFKQLALNAIECIHERELNRSDDIPLECVDSAIQFFLKMDLVMLSRSNATRVKQIGTGLKFMNIAHNIIHSKLNAMSVSLFWAFVLYSREYVQQLESKGLDYSSGIEVIFQLSTLYKNCTYTYAQIGLDLMPKVLDILVYAINNWNIEVDLVFDQSNSIKKLFIVMLTLVSPYHSQGFSVVDVFINAFKSISPPKTPRESLTLAYFKNQLQRGVSDLDEVKRLNEWYDSLPTPTGSTQDKTLILYHYENLRNIETARPDLVASHHELKNIEVARPTEEPKRNTACSFLLDAFLDLDEKWQSKVMTKFLLHCKTYCWLLMKEQEDILFEKLKELCKESKAKDRTEKWIVQLAINCERISEYRELVISTIMDPANSNLLGMGAYSNTNLLQAVLEEYEKEPRDAIEVMLLIFGEEIEMIPTEKLPPNIFPILINIIGKRIALRRVQNNPNEDIEEDSDESMDNEQYFLNEDHVDHQNEGDNENLQDDNKDEGDEHMDEKGIGLEIMEYSFDNSDDQDLPIEYGTRELVDLLMTLAARMNEDKIIKQNLLNMIDIIKTEYNNRRIGRFFEEIVEHFLNDRNEGNVALVADPIAESVADWIQHTNLTHQNISQGFAKMLKTLVKTCSKNFLTADVVSKLLPWLTLEDNVYERSQVILWVVSVWGVLVNHAVDPTHPTNVLYQMLETMLKSNNGAHLPRVLQYLTGLLHDGVFQSSKFVPLLNMAWKLDHNVGALNTADSDYIKAEFIGAAAQNYPSIVQENLQDTLNFFEDALGSVDDATDECSVPYVFLINLVEDPASWVHHMKIFLKVFLASGFDSERIAPTFPVLFKLISPDHPHHKLLCEDAAVRAEIQRILNYIRDFEGENQPELYKYYGV